MNPLLFSLSLLLHNIPLLDWHDVHIYTASSCLILQTTVRETFRYLWLVQLTFRDKLLKGELSKVGNFEGFESP